MHSDSEGCSHDEDHLTDSDEVLDPLYHNANCSSELRLMRAKKVVKLHLKDIVGDDDMLDGLDKRLVQGILHNLQTPKEIAKRRKLMATDFQKKHKDAQKSERWFAKRNNLVVPSVTISGLEE